MKYLPLLLIAVSVSLSTKAQFGVRLKCVNSIVGACFGYRVEYTNNDYVGVGIMVDSSLNSIIFRNVDSAKAFASQFTSFEKCKMWNDRMVATWDKKYMDAIKKQEDIEVIKIY